MESLARSFGSLLGILVCTGMIAALPVGAPAQRYSLYAYAFMSEDQQPSIQVNATIVYNSLIFFKKGPVFESTYELLLRVRDHKGKVVDTAVIKRSVTVTHYRDTKSNRMASKAAKNFVVAPGAYTLEATIVVKNTQLSSTKTVAVEVPDFLSAGIGLGSPRLFTISEDCGFASSAVVRGDTIDESRMSAVEGSSVAAIDKMIALRFDLYADAHRPGSQSCRLYVEVTDDRKNQLFYSSRNVRLTGRGDGFLVVLNVDDWEIGEYKMTAKIVMDSPRREAASSYTFGVEFSRAMLASRFDDTLAMLGIIASSDDLEELKSAEGAERLAAWKRFWAKRDPSPGSETNEALDEFLGRVRYATENFSTVEPGWKTDRGRVYIRYGPPDQIESTADSYAQGEYQIWRYNDLNLVFVFYDRYFGVGDFRLIGTDSY
jgi:GWxTD domain-containing protein